MKLRRKTTAAHKLRIIPLGGLGEIGKNMMALEYGNDIIVIDAGLMFPGEETPGVDLLIPDISYLLERQKNLRGIVITHGHEDHIGALPYVLSRIAPPVYATKFTRELISVELKQRGVKTKAKLNVVTPGSKIALGKFIIEFFSVCHSIPDSAGLIIHTPQGIVVHSGDFKIDYTPTVGAPTNFSQLAVLGVKDVLLLLSDSTYVELSGYTPSEMVVSDTLDRIISEAKGRVIVTTFASLVSRIQQVLDVAVKRDRRVFITGRSMKEIVNMALKTGYLTAPADVICRLDELRTLPHHRIVILSTGSQGEPTSALVRMANRDHRSQVRIVPGDTVVISATSIPGNEALVSKTIDSLFRQGANVIYDRLAQVHVHGHGSREELKLLLSLVKPKFFVPVHGEYRHLSLHANLAQSMGIPRDNIFVLENGDVLELGQDSGKVVAKTRVGVKCVSGLTTGELDDVVLQDRKLLSQDGVVVVTVAIDAESGRLAGRPRIMMRGFVDGGEEQTLIEQGQDVVLAALNHDRRRLSEPGFVDARMKDSLNRFFYERVRRRPVIIPVVVKVGKT
ncbi:MAG: ribonuclease J [Dehalococcoidia bacterium]|nr:ribonuclease J [Dehalococcoidia bacterium]RLC65319.1 MAG: ribonuclease J [Chloroflexota bacterium]